MLVIGGNLEIEQYLKEKKPLIDREMEKIIPRKISAQWLEKVLGKAKYAYDPETLTKSISAPIWDFLDRGGKRWRPALTLLACEAVGGKEKEAMPFTPIPELVHNGTIMHDDCQDDSKERRGKPCTHLIYGMDIAINTGSIMYFLPMAIFYTNSQKLPEKKVRQVYDMYIQEMMRVSIGQATDIYWHKGQKAEITEQQYLQMCLCKTGVLARFAAKLGAIIGNADSNRAEALAGFGESLGIGFQIQDDILELIGKEFAKGKGGIGGDIHEGKRTLMVIHTLQKASENDRKRLAEILNSHPTKQETINEAIEIIRKNGSIEYAKEKAENIVEEAWNSIDKKLPQSNAKNLLKELADYSVGRKI